MLARKNIALIISPPGQKGKKKNIQVRIQIAYCSATNWFKYLQAKFRYNKGREEKKEVGKGGEGWEMEGKEVNGEEREEGERGKGVTKPQFPDDAT